MISPTLAKAGRVAFIFGIINFAVYVLVAAKIGGDAVNGHSASGHYFLGEHGKLTETSYSVFLYSKLHTYTLFVSHPLAMLGIWINHRWKKQNEVADTP